MLSNGVTHFVRVGVEDLLPKLPVQGPWYGKLLPAKLSGSHKWLAGW